MLPVPNGNNLTNTNDLFLTSEFSNYRYGKNDNYLLLPQSKTTGTIGHQQLRLENKFPLMLPTSTSFGHQMGARQPQQLINPQQLNTDVETQHPPNSGLLRLF